MDETQFNQWLKDLLTEALTKAFEHWNEYGYHTWSYWMQGKECAAVMGEVYSGKIEDNLPEFSKIWQDAKTWDDEEEER